MGRQAGPHGKSMHIERNISLLHKQASKQRERERNNDAPKDKDIKKDQKGATTEQNEK